MLRMRNLKKCFEQAKKEKAKFVAVTIYTAGFEKPEIIINEASNFQAKVDYYSSAYNNDLTLKSAPDKIKIIGFTQCNSLKEAEELFFKK